MSEKYPYKIVKKELIKYPSPLNPRLSALDKTAPEIVALAESIRKNGLQYPVILRVLPDGAYDVIDGDRRCIAVFDILKKSTIKAVIEHVDETKARQMRIFTNYHRKTLSSMELGCCLWEDIEREMKKLGYDPIEEYWKELAVRGKMYELAGSRYDIPITTIRKCVDLWKKTKKDVRDEITYRKPVLQKGQIPTSVAFDIIDIGTKLGDTDKTWNVIQKPKVKEIIRKKVPRKVVKKAIREGRLKSTEELENFIKGTALETVEYTQLMRKETRDLIAKLANDFNVGMDGVVDASIHVAQNHPKELKTALGV